MSYVNPNRKNVRTIQVEEELMLHDSAAQKVYALNPSHVGWRRSRFQTCSGGQIAYSLSLCFESKQLKKIRP
ncbi:MAG: hypothetical protein ABFS56_34165 [Pseudomonadota bacterium]